MSTESEARKLSEAAAAASEHVFRGGPPPAGGGAQQVVPGRGGDWVCPGCNDLQFGKNEKCRRCGTPNPKPPAGGKGSGMRVGDWICPTCSDFQYARNAQCRRCGTPNPHRDAGAPARAMRPGDWQCPTCHDVVFARNAVCRRCQTPNPNASAGVNPNRFTGDLAELPAGQCRYFATGFCKEGAQCRYQHGDGSQGGGVGGPPPAGRRQCRFFAEGHCKQGDGCPYAHGDRGGGAQHKNDVQEEPWRCPSCGQFVFPHFSNCLSCKTPRPLNPERMAPVNVAPVGLEGQPMDGMLMLQGDPGQAARRPDRRPDRSRRSLSPAAEARQDLPPARPMLLPPEAPPWASRPPEAEQRPRVGIGPVRAARSAEAPRSPAEENETMLLPTAAWADRQHGRIAESLVAGLVAEGVSGQAEEPDDDWGETRGGSQDASASGVPGPPPAMSGIQLEALSSLLPQ